MTSLKRTLLLSTIAMGMSTIATAQTSSDSERYVIQYKDNARVNFSTQIASAKGEIKTVIPRQNVVAAVLPKAEAKKLKGDPNILSIEIDPKRYLMAEETPYGITMVQAQQLSDAGTGNQTVCITDTGFDRSHIDLQAVRVTGNDGYGGNDSGNWYNDGDGHGSHVAGTIAALGGNNEGVVGVNPGNKLNLHIVKVFDDNGNWAYGSDMAKAVEQCTDAGSNIISMSLGGGGSSAAEEAAFDRARDAGVLNIAAAGNDGNSSKSYPASYDSVVSVAAVDSSGTVADFSQYNNQVEIAAPGVAVKSTIPGNKYATWSGTSMATPHVAGVAALVWSHYPDCSGEEIRAALNATALDKGAAGRDTKYGYGIVQAKAAFDSLVDGCEGTTPPPPPPPPPPPSDNVLENGVAKTGIAGAVDEKIYYTMEVPAGATNLEFKMSGGTGDADLYVRFGSKPTQTTFDCSPYLTGNEETCTFAAPEIGTYHVMLDGYESFANVTLEGTFDDGSGGGANEAPVARWWVKCDGLTCRFVGANSSDSDGEIVSYYWWMEPGVAFKSDASMTHTFSAPGVYRPFLTVKDDDGAKHRKRRKITVSETGTMEFFVE